ncbi:hypothetical protein UA08_00812 [Talaromyces atroroseus]|uniref:Calcineurin-like phosphoesterase domain-containing protein n=1 Tax=Talaromyces atroroseus TaxID=1441469 RepID=A0A225BAU1_TALAT|nr:hypothetical protein UA08_00812 [Talaromyces atroroseus]OKL64516.1 hypothetical protein UA08_00812 [Talaromyces atroroseus]
MKYHTIPEPINTKILLISETHGQPPLSNSITEHIDVAIHCGDLTNESKIEEFQNMLRYIREDLPQTDLKLVIAGNHDFTLDIPAFKNIVANARPVLEPELAGNGDADDNIFLLDEEGTYEFQLRNGALLRVYASPFTPSLSGDWGFQYHLNQGHTFDIPDNVDVVITHGPPRGILDYSANSSSRAGCPDLFRAVARVQPKLHCFGHIHEGWGAKLRARQDRRTGDLVYFSADAPGLNRQEQMLFVNAALQGETGIGQIPWLVSVKLPCAQID